MTEVDFYILSAGARDDRFSLTCRLANKIYQQGRRAYIHAANDAEARHLDRLLWTFRQDSFLPHGMIDTADREITPVLIGWEGDALDENDVLINLSGDIPVFFSRFRRVAEPVDQSPGSLESGRERFRFYRDRGYPLQSHDIER